MASPRPVILTALTDHEKDLLIDLSAYVAALLGRRQTSRVLTVSALLRFATEFTAAPERMGEWGPVFERAVMQAGSDHEPVGRKSYYRRAQEDPLGTLQALEERELRMARKHAHAHPCRCEDPARPHRLCEIHRFRPLIMALTEKTHDERKRALDGTSPDC